MWNAASASAPRAICSLFVTALTVVALVIAAAGGASQKPPSDLTVTAATKDSLSLSWPSAHAHGHRTITGYHLYLDSVRQTTQSGDDLVPDTNFVFGSLRCGWAYTFGVEAVDDSGATSDVGSVMASTSPCSTDTSPPSEDSSTPAPTSAPAASNTTVAGQDDATDSIAADAFVNAASASTSGSPTFTAAADARVDESQPDTNFGVRKVLRVDSGGDPDIQDYLRFDVSGLSGSVTAAKLRLYAATRTADGPTVYAAPNTWSETGITWNTRPSLGSPAAHVGSIAADSWVEWDVTNLVSGDGTYSLVLAGSSSDGVTMSSRESGVAPQLVISTDASGPGPTPGGDTTPPSAPGRLALVSRSASDIAVSWSRSSDDVGVAGYDLLLNGTKTRETTSLSASFGGLVCGQSYTIGVRAFDAAGNRSNPSSLTAATLACTSPGPSGGVNWYPGYYVLAHDSKNHQQILDDPLVAPFTGAQFRYFWSDSELAPHDYSAGYAALDADLQLVASKSKKLLIMLQYKKNDGTSAVPADLLKSPGPWCSGPYCGELVGDVSKLAMVWNPAVDARLQAWISAMAAHAAASPYASSVAGIIFNETALGTTDATTLRAAGYDPYAYMKGLQDNMLAATSAAPRLPVFYYHEGGFISLDGQSVNSGQIMGNWMLQHPHTGTGTPDLKPKSPKGPAHPCAIAEFQGLVPCAPAVEAPDYATSVTDSLDQSYNYAFSSAPGGLHASFLTFVYTPGSGPNAFTFADVSRYIPSHPIPNTALPPGW